MRTRPIRESCAHLFGDRCGRLLRLVLRLAGSDGRGGRVGGRDLGDGGEAAGRRRFRAGHAAASARSNGARRRRVAVTIYRRRLHSLLHAPRRGD